MEVGITAFCRHMQYASCFHVGIFFDKLLLLASSRSLQVQQSRRNSAVHHTRELESSLMPFQYLKSVNHELVYTVKS